MKPEIASALQRIRIACASVLAPLTDHQQLLNDLALLEANLTRRNRERTAPAAAATNAPK